MENTLLKGLDLDIETSKGRLDRIEQSLKENEEFLTHHFDTRYTRSVHRVGFQAEQDTVCLRLQTMADYILYADKQEQKETKESSHILVKHQLEYRQENENATDDITTSENRITAVAGQVQKNYKLDDKTKIEPNDRKELPELGETGRMIGYLKFAITTGYHPASHLELDFLEIATMTNAKIKELLRGVDTSSLIKVGKSEKYKLTNIMKGVRQDELIMKEQLKGTIRFKRISSSEHILDLDHFTFSNKEHVKAILDNYSSLHEDFYEDTMSDMKAILFTFEDLVESTPLEEYQKDILILHIDGKKQDKITDIINEKYDMNLSQQAISKIVVKTLPEAIVETYQRSKEDWVFTYLSKGLYKQCKTCKSNKIASSLNFRKEKKGKYGLKATCKECEKAKA